MQSNLVLVVGLTHSGTPTNIYLGYDFSAAKTAAAAAANDYPFVQVFRNLGIPYQEFRATAAGSKE